MTQVLIIEDNIAVLEGIAFELEMQGYEVVKTEDGQQAIDYLNSADRLPDIVVSDIAMPNVDGYKLLEHFRQDSRWEATPFIFLTAFTSPNAVRLGKELGVDDYLTKPFDTQDLVIAIENKLRRVAQMRRESERKFNTERQELMKIISHELRTPLSAIFGGVEMLAENIDQMPDEMSQRMLNIVRSGARRMTHLVSQIMYLVEVDSGHMQQMIEKAAYPCDLGEVVYNAVDMTLNEWEYSPPSVQIRQDVPSKPLYVRGAQDFLTIAVSEIVRNAVTFSPENGAVTVSLREQDGFGIITVTDNGTGIAPDDLSRVWERFVQINRDQFEQQGTGLGLALVSECVRLHAGECTINSTPGEGTEVTLRLPLVPSPED